MLSITCNKSQVASRHDLKTLGIIVFYAIYMQLALVLDKTLDLMLHHATFILIPLLKL